VRLPFIGSGLAVVTVAALYLVLGLHETAHSQPKKVSGRIGNVAVRARTELFLAENTADPGRLDSLSRTLTSTDPDWHNATTFSVRFSDPFMRQERRYHGHAVNVHPGGDQTFVEYKGRWTPRGGGDFDWETTGRFVGGTGRFRGVTGTWRERGVWTQTSAAGEWEAAYELR
jgi:hypothetical protein